MVRILWTRRELKILKALYEAGATICEIQRVFPSRTDKAIAQIAHAHGFRKTNLWGEEDRKLLQSLWENDIAVEEIANIFELTQEQIRNAVTRMGYKRSPAYIKKTNSKNRNKA